MDIRVFGGKDHLAKEAASAVSHWLESSDWEAPSLGLAGGSTPGLTYDRLREQTLDWGRVRAWMGDERFVPPDHVESNSAMVKRKLVDHISDLDFEPVPWRAGATAHALAESYEEKLVEEGRLIEPALVLLGLGSDGHTCSLFPGTDALNERDRLFVANWVPKLEQWRLTATFPLLARAHRLVFLASGAEKAEAVASVIERRVPLPARQACESARNVTWFLDRDAASLLKSPR